MALHFKKKRFFKQILAVGLSLFATFPFWAQAEENPNDWVVLQSSKIDAGHIWSASTLYSDKAKHKTSVCALDYKVTSETVPKAHPFVFLVSRMSRELWTTDHAWDLRGSENGKFTLKIDQKKHFFELDPENEYILMTLVRDNEIDEILGELEKADHAEVKLAARGANKDLHLRLKGIVPVLEAFRQCLSAPEIAYGKKINVKNDTQLPKVFKE
ncbi:hypothetical protein FAI41_03815 [Acetobacteraceae bacterium]|nr:hypothetical protein FAI41_03815 [Acetobacteraceae bacterium]